jgi:cyclic pyranopterin phosphate synthase
MGDFSHLDGAGRARMVDVGDKQPTARVAVASARVRTRAEVVEQIAARAAAKGDVLAVARVAGIQAAKRTAELIPLCHPLGLDTVAVDFELSGELVSIRATARCHGKTGVEMEALTAATVAALTIYDMCKAVDRAMVIERVQLEEKSGGKSGHFVREAREKEREGQR